VLLTLASQITYGIMETQAKKKRKGLVISGGGQHPESHPVSTSLPVKTNAAYDYPAPFLHHTYSVEAKFQKGGGQFQPTIRQHLGAPGKPSSLQFYWRTRGLVLVTIYCFAS